MKTISSKSPVVFLKPFKSISALWVLMLGIALSASQGIAQSAPPDWDWESLYNAGLPGASDRVLSIVEDGSGNIYVGGCFTVVGNIVANYVAKWDGTRWTALGSGMNGWVYALAVNGSNVYAAGGFTVAGGVAANHIAKWDGTSWSALGAGTDDCVFSLAVVGNDVYAGGRFYKAGNSPVGTIAKWDGSAWSGLGWNVKSLVSSMAVIGTDLYVAGEIDVSGGRYGVAKWDGLSWSALGSGMYATGSVWSVTASGSDVYIAGMIEMGSSPWFHYVAKWDGSAWSQLGASFDQMAARVAVSGTNIYVSGTFTHCGGVPVNYLARWDGGTWVGLPSWPNSAPVSAMIFSGTNLYLGGGFTFIGAGSRTGALLANYIAKWDGNAWSTLGSGLNEAVYTLAQHGNDLYAGGYFSKVGQTDVNGIVKWDGHNWSPLSSGVGGPGFGGYRVGVRALAVMGEDLYVGGNFRTAGGVVVNSIAKWDGTEWSALGPGVDGTVRALLVAGTDLYVGGNFTNAGNVRVNCIAKWDGTCWSPLGAGFSGRIQIDTYGVHALAAVGNAIYAGGSFTNAGAIDAYSIAKWTGSSWSGLGSGMNTLGEVDSLAVLNNELFVGGSFTNAGGTPANCVAKWNGNSWSGLGEGFRYSVFALNVSGGNLFAGGLCSYNMSYATNYVSRWDGKEWSRLESGLSGENPYVYALTSDTADHLYVGGRFTMAGSKVSPYIIKRKLNPLEGRGSFANLTYSTQNGFSCTVSNGTFGMRYIIQKRLTASSGSWTEITNFIYTVPITITLPADASGTIYRAISP